jgi:hypothetical protein
MSEVAAVGGKKLKKAVKPKQKAGVNKMQMLIMRPEFINMIPVINTIETARITRASYSEYLRH